MASKTQTLKFKQTVNAPPAEVYRAFTNSTALREWLCDAAQADRRKGGRVHLWWNAGQHMTGEFAALVPDKKVAFTWRGRSDPAATNVQVSFTAKNGGTLVTLTHSGVGAGKVWADAVAGFKHEWPRSLENLKSVLETGRDLRFTLRPMLGIQVDTFDAETAARLGVPVKEGIRLSGVVEGMGAEAAGLQKDDVIVGVGGRKTHNWSTLADALQAHRAGDGVKVVFYRGGAKQTVAMKLSGRPIDEPPATAAELAEAVRKMHAEFDASLAAVFEGVSEEEASHQPGPDEWSAKDVVCHLLGGERDTHAWIIDLIGGEERWSDGWAGNIRTRHVGILAAFPTVPALLEELKRNELETAAMLAALPEAFVARKGSFWRLAYGVLDSPSHNAGHLDQIRAAIASARKP